MIIFLKLVCKSPVLKQQLRIGKKGKQFNLYLFTENCVSNSEVNNSSGSRNKKRVEKLLKKWGFYKYPQLWNVLKGDISLVGPRAESPGVVKTYSDVQKHKLIVQPGITGLWDISPHKQSILYQDKDMDIYYIQNQSLFLDIIILLRKSFRFF